MANSYQKVIYSGHLGADPVMRFTTSGQAVTNFRMASNSTYKSKTDEKVSTTTWIRVTCWGKLAEIINSYCETGSHVLVEGTLKPGENGSPEVFQLKSGEYASSYDVTAKDITILKGKGKVEGEGSAIPF